MNSDVVHGKVAPAQGQVASAWGKVTDDDSARLVDAPSFHREDGAIGYIALWFLGVPASVLFVIFLLRGCN